MYAEGATAKANIGRRFARAVARYNLLARHQAIAARHLAERIADLPAPCRLLELGCGTGLLTRHLRACWPAVRLTVVDLAPAMVAECRRAWLRSDDRAVSADAEEFWPTDGVDAVVSSCALQWFHDPAGWLAAARRRIAPGGWLAAAIPIAGTLREFAISAPAGTPRLSMPDAGAWRERFVGAGWRSLDTVTETLTLWYPRALDVLRALHGIGATCALPGAPALRAREIRTLADAYERRYREARGVPCTYELLYAVARA